MRREEPMPSIPDRPLAIVDMVSIPLSESYLFSRVPSDAARATTTRHYVRCEGADADFAQDSGSHFTRAVYRRACSGAGPGTAPVARRTR